MECMLIVHHIVEEERVRTRGVSYLKVAKSAIEVHLKGITSGVMQISIEQIM